MSVLHLRAADLIDPRTEARCARLALDDLSTTPHDHDFCEVFLIEEGSVTHVVNGVSIALQAGALVFIRPADQHHYQREGSDRCILTNLAVYQSVVDALFTYFAIDGWRARYMQPSLPPVMQLAPSQRHHITARLHRLVLPLSYPLRTNADSYRSAVRVVLAELFTEGFAWHDQPRDQSIPAWLYDLLQEVEQPGNLERGLGGLYALAQRSPEHIAREFRRYLGVTPSQYLNRLRLTHAAHALIHTNTPILTVALANGFDTLSYFYRLFKAQYGVSPYQYRRQNQRRLIP
ncbi:MAG: AraC family transcriptional regulator [bacterium]|nr:AraC family transcriptional regulator [bacterium]